MIVIVGLAAWLLTLLLTFFFFDRLLRFEYTNFRGNWERGGKPYGFFWCPREVRVGQGGFWKHLRSDIAHQRVRFDWLFVTPSWVKLSIRTRMLLYAWRVLFFLGVGFVTLPVLLTMVSEKLF